MVIPMDSKSKGGYTLESIKAIDLGESENLDFSLWIAKSSLDDVHELNSQLAAKMIDMTKQPSLFLFMDKTDASREILQMMYYLADTYKQHVNLVFAREATFLKMRHLMGVSARSFPQVTIASVNGVFYPYRREEHGYLKPQTLEKFIKEFISNRVTPFTDKDIALTSDDSVVQRLSHSAILNLTELNHTLREDKDLDVLAFFKLQVGIDRINICAANFNTKFLSWEVRCPQHFCQRYISCTQSEQLGRETWACPGVKSQEKSRDLDQIQSEASPHQHEQMSSPGHHKLGLNRYTILAFFYSSEKNTHRLRRSLSLASNFDTAAMRLDDHNILTVDPIALDVYKHGLPDYLHHIEVPSIVLITAKRDKMVIFDSDYYHKAQSLIEFVQEHASLQFALKAGMHLGNRANWAREKGSSQKLVRIIDQEGINNTEEL